MICELPWEKIHHCDAPRPYVLDQTHTCQAPLASFVFVWRVAGKRNNKNALIKWQHSSCEVCGATTSIFCWCTNAELDPNNNALCTAFISTFHLQGPILVFSYLIISLGHQYTTCPSPEHQIWRRSWPGRTPAGPRRQRICRLPSTRL